MHLPRLNATETGRLWISQFAIQDRLKAAALLDEMLLLNDQEVTGSLLWLLGEYVPNAGPSERVALYAEREFGGERPFVVACVPDETGRVRRRAIGRNGPAPVKPLRGSSRVGSEGMVAFVISQAVKSWPKVFLNHPGPDRFRGRRPVRTLVIVTDFIGSGARVLKMLDGFWAIPTVRAWTSRGWLHFIVIAAAGTSQGVQKVRAYPRVRDVLVRHVAPTLHGTAQQALRDLAEAYGPTTSAGAGRLGFGDCGALIAFSYGIPNNTPLILHATAPGWRPLFNGPAPPDARPAFGLQTPAQRIAQAAEAVGAEIRAELSSEDATLVVLLRAIRGRWRTGAATAMAEMTGLTEPELLAAQARAVRQGLLDAGGRLTDAGRAAVGVARPVVRRPTIPTNEKPYYPTQLRAPRGLSSNSRPSGRPR